MISPKIYSCKRCAIALLFLLISSAAIGQTWEVVLKKAEKQYTKGKYAKVEKALKKLRSKHIAKKYKGDSSLYPLTYIMEARADYALADFRGMETNLNTALKTLPKWKNGHTYNYTMGMLRIIDFYNEYGNHRKADSLTTILEGLSTAYLQNDLLVQEIKIRRAFTDVAMGSYDEALAALKELITTWPTKLKLSYSFEAVNSEDEAYKTQLLIDLFTAEVEAYRGKGEYQKAIELLDTRNKQVNRLVEANTEAYIDFRIAEANVYLDYGDATQARKVSDQLITMKPKGKLMEKAGFANIMANEHEGRFGDAVTTSMKVETALIKAKVSREYAYFNTEFLNTLMRSYERDTKQNIVMRFNSLISRTAKLLPEDHRTMTLALENGIQYIFDIQRSENYPLAEKFYVRLGESLNTRYGKTALQTNIYQINFAGYYLKYSENPARAYKLLAGEVYKKPLTQLSTQHPDYARIVTDLMEYFTLTGNFDYPIALTKSVVEAMVANPNTTNAELGDKLVELARLQIQGGYYKDAELNADEALKVLRRGGERKSEEFVKALNSAAFLYGTIGLYNKAENQLRKSESIYKKIATANQELRLESIVDLAFLYTRMGNYSETEELVNMAIAERKKLYGSNSRRLIKPYSALGEVFMIRGDYPESEKNLRAALAIAETVYGDTTLIFAETLSKMVKLYLDLGNYEAALVNATDVLKIREKTLRPNHILFADTYTDLGHIHYNLGSQLQVVDKYYQLAKEITASNFDQQHPLYAEALKNIAFVHLQRAEYNEALTLLDQADDIWRDALSNQNRSSGEVARIKGDIYNYQGKFREARREYEKAAKYFKRIFSEEHPDFLNTQSRLARAYYINDEVSKVESILSETTLAYLNYTKTYFPTLSEDEKAKFWNKIKPDFEFYNTVAVRYSTSKEKYLENMYDFALATKGLLLNSSIKTRNSILHSGDEQLISLFKTWVSKKEYLTTTLAQSSEDANETEVDIKKLKDEIAVLEKQLSESSDAFEDSFEYKLYTWNDIRKSLKENEAAIEIIRYREFDDQFNDEKIRYAALIVTSETKKNPELVLFEDGNEMETRHFMYHRNVTKYKIADANSFGVFWEPIYNKVRDKEIVYLSPDGIYNQLNVESFKINETEYVIDKMNVRVVNNTKTIAALRSREAKKVKKDEEPREFTAMLLGNPNYYETDENRKTAQREANRGGANVFVPQLPGTEQEVITINDLLKTKGWKIEYYLGENATENQIKQSQNYTLVHIATHGFFDDKAKAEKKPEFMIEEDDNPLDRAGLLAEGGGDVLVKATKNYNIDDGVLTAHEAMNLNFDKTELIVLSACETGRGEIQQGEGVFGLQRSFLVAGADAIVMSLFQVSDEVTQKLMVEFYKNWLNGQDKRTAFNNAQLTIKAQYNDPIYWGAFTMIAKS
ncbi:MAG: CHAT domain-containing tetratricopeptide repeat protein [Marinoscillum sp.]|uniref:CHAT domain-containing protein n=1 Tax=Marinoscillum sp. TaxID=2024838 RepID=UPI0032F61A62